MAQDFVHLHVHSEYSLLDGACRIDRAPQLVQALGQHALAITDHGVMSGAVAFTKACHKAGVRPIVGQEFYVAPGSRFDRVYQVDNKPYHLVLLAKDETGYQNLCRLSSEGWVSGFYSKPRVDKELLAKYHEGLIALSACLAGELPRKITQGQFELAKKAALEYADIFGRENFYVELQNHGMAEQRAVLPDLIRICRQTGLEPVITNDAHYCTRADAHAQHVLMCISTNRTLGEAGGLEFATNEFYLKSREQMEQAFAGYEQEVVQRALDNTVRIANRCCFDFTFGQLKLPDYRLGQGKDKPEFFRQLCQQGLEKRYGDHPAAEILNRMEYEIGVIAKMGFLDYYLIVWDFVRYAKAHDIPVGPGRGSGAGSLVSYLIGITDVDPIRYGLLFERFLNPQRVSMPDFDIDFCYEKRQQVIDYVIDTYGADKVCQIVTFGTLAARAVIRDVGRAMGTGYATCDRVAKLIPRAIDITIDRSMQLNPELKTEYDNNPEVRGLIDTARTLEGMPRHASTHAAGVVVTPKGAMEFLPLQKNDEAVVTQYTKETVEELGLLKIDFLGLRTLTVIDRAVKDIKARQNADFSMEDMGENDSPTYEMLSKGQTGGVFQLESAGMRQLLTQLKPQRMEDIIAAISLYRPGPMESIPAYLKNRQNPDQITYLHPLLEPILRDTCGVVVYQEQVMQICRELAGFSLGRSDLVRRAMAKKKADVMEAERSNFIYGNQNADGVAIPGCVAKGIAEKTAGKIFDEMSSFASYAFNKSHAAGYAVLAYRTAWLKCHYPKAFMAAMLTVYLGDTNKMISDINECKRLGIAVLPPDVNRSEIGFAVQPVPGSPGETGIRFGLLAIKNVGRSLLDALVAERQANGLFADFVDFCTRMSAKELNARTLESLVRSGALDGFDCNRCQMINMADSLMNSLSRERSSRVTGQISLFETASDVSQPQMVQKPNLPEYPQRQLLAMEKEMTGLYLSGHPLDIFRPLAQKLQAVPLEELFEAQEDSQGAVGDATQKMPGEMGQRVNRWKDGARVVTLALVCARRNRLTKAGDRMASLILEDWTATLEGMIFPKQFVRLDRQAAEGEIRIVCGRLSAREDDPVSLSVEEIFMPDDQSCQAAVAWKNRQGKGSRSNLLQRPAQSPQPVAQATLFCRLPTPESYDIIADLICTHHGWVPLALFFESENQQGTKKYDYQPQSLWVDGSNELVDALKSRIGAENVVLRTKK